MELIRKRYKGSGVYLAHLSPRDGNDIITLMEPQSHSEASTSEPLIPLEAEEPKRPKNPAQKWLFVSAAGLIVCFMALGVHVLRGGAGSPQPLPPKVLRQVFGFTPYYFNANTPPDNLLLQKDSPKFYGNALTFKLTDTKKEEITISQMAIPTPVPKAEGESMSTNLGSATIKTSGGHISGVLITSDKTYIMLSASDIISSGTFIDIYNSLHTVSKGAAATL